MRTFGLIIAAILPLAAHLCAQDQEPETPGRARFSALAANTARLTRTITLDRTEYLPGENIRAVVTVVNSTPAALEVVDPIRMGRIYLVCKVEDPAYPAVHWLRCDFGTWDEAQPVFLPGQVNNLMDGVVTTVLQPGQRIEEHLALMDEPSSGIKAGPFWILRPGEYRLSYCPRAADCSTAEFRIADFDHAGLLVKAHTPWLELQTERSRKIGQADMCVGVLGAVLRSNGQYVTVVTHPGKDVCARYGWEEGFDGPGWGVGRDLIGFTRVATSPTPPARLFVFPNSPDDIRVEIEDPSGARQVIYHRDSARQ